MKIDQVAVGKRITQLRVKCGKTLEQLGAELTPPKNFRSISSYELGKLRVSVSVLFQLCRLLETTPSWLIFGKEPTVLDEEEAMFLAAVRDLGLEKRRVLAAMMNAFTVGSVPRLQRPKRVQSQRDRVLRRLLAEVDQAQDGLRTDDPAQTFLEAIELMLIGLVEPPKPGPGARDTKRPLPARVGEPSFELLVGDVGHK